MILRTIPILAFMMTVFSCGKLSSNTHDQRHVVKKRHDKEVKMPVLKKNIPAKKKSFFEGSMIKTLGKAITAAMVINSSASIVDAQHPSLTDYSFASSDSNLTLSHKNHVAKTSKGDFLLMLQKTGGTMGSNDIFVQNVSYANGSIFSPIGLRYGTPGNDIPCAISHYGGYYFDAISTTEKPSGTKEIGIARINYDSLSTGCVVALSSRNGEDLECKSAIFKNNKVYIAAKKGPLKALFQEFDMANCLLGYSTIVQTNNTQPIASTLVTNLEGNNTIFATTNYSPTNGYEKNFFKIRHDGSITETSKFIYGPNGQNNIDHYDLDDITTAKYANMEYICGTERSSNMGRLFCIEANNLKNKTFSARFGFSTDDINPQLPSKFSIKSTDSENTLTVAGSIGGLGFNFDFYGPGTANRGKIKATRSTSDKAVTRVITCMNVTKNGNMYRYEFGTFTKKYSNGKQSTRVHPILGASSANSACSHTVNFGGADFSFPDNHISIYPFSFSTVNGEPIDSSPWHHNLTISREVANERDACAPSMSPTNMPTTSPTKKLEESFLGGGWDEFWQDLFDISDSHRKSFGKWMFATTILAGATLMVLLYMLYRCIKYKKSSTGYKCCKGKQQKHILVEKNSNIELIKKFNLED